LFAALKDKTPAELVLTKKKKKNARSSQKYTMAAAKVGRSSASSY
jgi:hypothetical protein